MFMGIDFAVVDGMHKKTCVLYGAYTMSSRAKRGDPQCWRIPGLGDCFVPRNDIIRMMFMGTVFTEINGMHKQTPGCFIRRVRRAHETTLKVWA